MPYVAAPGRAAAFGTVRAPVLLAAAIALVACGDDPTSPTPPPPLLHRTLTVLVADSLGSPAESVQVRLVSERDSAGFAYTANGVTDAQGALVVVLIEGEWGVHGQRLGTRRVAGATFDVPGSTRPAIDTLVVRIVLHTASTAHGRVRLGGRIDHSGVTVDCPPVPTAQVTGMSGNYQLDLLPLGHWTITYFAIGFEIGLEPIDVLTPGEDLAVPDLLLVSNPIPD